MIMHYDDDTCDLGNTLLVSKQKVSYHISLCHGRPTSPIATCPQRSYCALCLPSSISTAYVAGRGVQGVCGPRLV